MTDFDVAIIGGGIAGVASGSYLAEQQNVVLLETEAALAHHTTGRSAAHFLENYGGEVCRRLAIASRSYFESPPKEFVDVELFLPGAVLNVGRESDLGELERLAREGAEFVESIAYLDEEAALKLCEAIRPGVIAGAVYEPASQAIDVMSLHQGFVRTMRASGAEIRREAGVTGLTRVGESWEVTTTQGTLRANAIVNAAGAWVDEVALMAGVRPIGIMPLRRTAFTSKPKQFDPNWPMVYMVDESFYCYPETGGFLFCSPADETPSDPCDAKAEELDVAMGIEVINEAMDVDLRSVQTAWAGLRSFVDDRQPVIGFDDEVPGFFWMAGQGSTGILTSPASGMAARDLFEQGELSKAFLDLGLAGSQLSPARLSDRSIKYGDSPQAH